MPYDTGLYIYYKVRYKNDNNFKIYRYCSVYIQTASKLKIMFIEFSYLYMNFNFLGASISIINKVLNNEFGLKEYKTIFSPVTTFNQWEPYLNTVYKRGSVVIYKLNKDIGDNKFEQLLKEIYKKYKYKNINTENFLEILTKITGKNEAQTFKDMALGEKKLEISDIMKNIDLSKLAPIERQAVNIGNKVQELKNNGYNIDKTFNYLINNKEDTIIVYGTDGNEIQNKDMKLAAESISKETMKEPRSEVFPKCITDKEALKIKKIPDVIIIVGNPYINEFYKIINEKLDIQVYEDKISILDFTYNIESEKYFFSYVVDNYIDKSKKILAFYSKDGTELLNNYRGYYHITTFGGGKKSNPDFLGLIVEKNGEKEVMIFDEEGKVKDK